MKNKTDFKKIEFGCFNLVDYTAHDLMVTDLVWLCSLNHWQKKLSSKRWWKQVILSKSKCLDWNGPLILAVICNMITVFALLKQSVLLLCSVAKKMFHLGLQAMLSLLLLVFGTFTIAFSFQNEVWHVMSKY